MKTAATIALIVLLAVSTKATQVRVTGKEVNRTEILTSN
jgi:hypothetical protein